MSIVSWYYHKLCHRQWKTVTSFVFYFLIYFFKTCNSLLNHNHMHVLMYVMSLDASVYLYVQAHWPVWRSEIGIWRLKADVKMVSSFTSLIFIITINYYYYLMIKIKVMFWDSILLNLTLPFHLDWLTNNPLGFTSLQSLVLGLQALPPCFVFMWMLGIQTLKVLA